MAQDEDGAVMLGELLEGVADSLGLFVACGLFGGAGGRVGAGLGGRGILSGVWIKRDPGLALAPAQFVVAEVGGDAPNEGSEARGGLVLGAVGEDFGERFLGEILGAVGVGGHPLAEAADALVPTFDEQAEGAVIVIGVDRPHGLFVVRRVTGGVCVGASTEHPRG